MTWIKPTQPYLRRGDPLNQGVVGCWPMSEGCGPDTRDISGRGNHATLVNGPTRVMTAMGRAIRFASTSDRVVIPDNGFPTDVFSISVWIFIDELASVLWSQNVIWAHWEDDNNRVYLFQNRDTDKLSVYGKENSVVSVQVSCATVLQKQRWYHVAVSFDSVANQCCIYLDGKLDGSGTYTETTPVADHTLHMESNLSQLAEAMALIHSRVLAPAEIRKLAGLDGDPYVQWRPMPRRLVYAMRRWIDRSYPRGVLRGVQQGVA